jgi:glutamyl-tRNA reductase
MGEAEILGQVRAAIGAAEDAGSAGPHVRGLFRFAIVAGRRARSTADRTLAPSLPRLALDTVVGDAHTHAPTVVLGSGMMAAATARELSARAIDYWVCARRSERAARLTARADRVIDFAHLTAFLERAGVVFCATGARSPLVRVADLRAAIERREAGRPLTIVDLSMPRNVEPEARQLAGLRLFDLDDLVEHSTDGQIRRRQRVVDEELLHYQAWSAGRAVGPLLVQLHDRIHTDCQRMIERSSSELPPGKAPISARRVANKLLHGPTVTIKNLIAAGDEQAALAVLATYGITRPDLGASASRHVLTCEAT